MSFEKEQPMIAESYDISLDVVFERASPALRKKIQYSIDLLRKAKDLALRYSSDGFYLAFSGGKDSQALYHVAKLAGVPFKGHMNLTSVDPPQVIMFVKKHYPSVELHKPVDSIYNIAYKRKYLLPSRLIRWCCADLKEKGGAGTVTLTGIRKAESLKRSKRSPVEVSNRSFAGELDQFFEWQKEQIEAKLPNINQDQFADQGESEVRCVNGKDKIIINPIIDWSDHDVWHFLNDVVRVPHCELYDMGWHRIGCICCPMSSYKHKVKELKMFPHVKRNWIKAIKKIRKDCIGDNMIVNNYWGEGTEDEQCEQIFNWWISGKSYEKWAPNNFQQLKIKWKEE